jgi:two-component sensor histidine kinase
LLKEIHHRVKNNLQVISSLLCLQSDSAKEPHDLNVFEESRHRTRSMALIHEKLYRSQDLTKIDFAEYARGLAADLLYSYKPRGAEIRFEVTSENIFLRMDTAIPCGLILNELVSNAFKHAFPDGQPGTVRINIQTAGNERLHLYVEDDGVDLSPNFDVSEIDSLGLQLVQTLTEQLEGTLTLGTGTGTKFHICFPG